MSASVWEVPAELSKHSPASGSTRGHFLLQVGLPGRSHAPSVGAAGASEHLEPLNQPSGGISPLSMSPKRWEYPAPRWVSGSVRGSGATDQNPPSSATLLHLRVPSGPRLRQQPRVLIVLACRQLT